AWEAVVPVPPAGTGMYGLDAIGGYVAGDTIAVTGPGPVGLMTVQLCKALGAERVILVGTRKSRLDLGAQLGADAVVDARQGDVVAAVRGAAGRRGVDVVIEASGALEAPQQCIEIVRRGGGVLGLAHDNQQVTVALAPAAPQ